MVLVERFKSTARKMGVAPEKDIDQISVNIDFKYTRFRNQELERT